LDKREKHPLNTNDAESQLEGKFGERDWWGGGGKSFTAWRTGITISLQWWGDPRTGPTKQKLEEAVRTGEQSYYQYQQITPMKNNTKCGGLAVKLIQKMTQERPTGSP